MFLIRKNRVYLATVYPPRYLLSFKWKFEQCKYADSMYLHPAGFIRFENAISATALGNIIVDWKFRADYMHICFNCYQLKVKSELALRCNKLHVYQF